VSLSTALARWLPKRDERAASVHPSVTSNFFDWLAPTPTTGVSVTPQSSLRSTTVMACVNLIARSLASVPLVLYSRQGASRKPAEDHPLYPLLHDLANPLQTAMEVRETLFANCLLYGNSYAEIEWSEDGYPAALWPLPSDCVGLQITPDRKLIYTYYDNLNGLALLPKWRVHHLRGLSLAGLLGISPIREAMNAVGLSIAAEDFGGLYFGNGARPSLVLSHPAKLTPEAMVNLRTSFEKQWSGLGNAHRVAVVGEGVKPEPIGIPPNEAQFLETRAFQVAEICRIFNVSPGLVGAAETQTYASAEQDMLRFRELTLGPWAEAHEKTILRDLLTPEERRTLFAKYRLDKLQATDLATRYTTYNTAKTAGILTTNEIRGMEDLNPIDGGDILWMPANMSNANADPAEGDQAADPQRAGAESEVQPDDQDDDDGDSTPDMQRALLPLVADARRRITARVANDVRQSGAKALRAGGRQQLAVYIEHVYADWRQAAGEMLMPIEDTARAVGVNVAADISTWIDEAVHVAVGELTNGN
jgi:HK97 family phage portal protein